MYIYRCHEMQESDSQHYYFKIEPKLNNDYLIVHDNIDISPNK